ncbi:Hypothetical predicted protein [Mytilus galloprovincialis]|uniref:PHD-type domain-containing protein n=1 Tax=Mytilus galloprovincialis TaxID=29158 RepID=A0A8B6ECI6_MYTGA|nr:Hypothetical predicted protein [Mytilus galloprovincialis]
MLTSQGVEGLSTEQLNRQLGNQLQSLLHKDNNSTIRTGTNKKQEVEEGNDTSTKCNQRCKTRSTYCDKGSHWVHYKCQKLSELEIQMAENSNGDEYYECKLCIAAKSNILALEGSTQSHTNAQLLLTEETEAKRGYNTDETLDTSPEEQNCTVCDNILMDPEWDIYANNAIANATSSVLLESRCQQLEARNFELEQTVKLLKRRIESNSNLTIPTLTNTGEPKQGNTDSFQKMKEQLDEKLAKLHTKLSNIVIDEMDRQINKIKLFDDCPHISEERLKATQGTGDEKGSE